MAVLLLHGAKNTLKMPLEAACFAFTLMFIMKITSKYKIGPVHEQNCLFHHIGVLRGGLGHANVWLMVSHNRVGVSCPVLDLLEQKKKRLYPSCRLFGHRVSCWKPESHGTRRARER